MELFLVGFSWSKLAWPDLVQFAPDDKWKFSFPGFQTLGEEYVNIVQVDSSEKAIPARWVCEVETAISQHIDPYN